MALIVSRKEAAEHSFRYAQPRGDTGYPNHYLGQLRLAAGNHPALDVSNADAFLNRVSDDWIRSRFRFSERRTWRGHCRNPYNQGRRET